MAPTSSPTYEQRLAAEAEKEKQIADRAAALKNEFGDRFSETMKGRDDDARVQELGVDKMADLLAREGINPQNLGSLQYQDYSKIADKAYDLAYDQAKVELEASPALADNSAIVQSTVPELPPAPDEKRIQEPPEVEKPNLELPSRSPTEQAISQPAAETEHNAEPSPFPIPAGTPDRQVEETPDRPAEHDPQQEAAHDPPPQSEATPARLPEGEPSPRVGTYADLTREHSEIVARLEAGEDLDVPGRTSISEDRQPEIAPAIDDREPGRKHLNFYEDRNDEHARAAGDKDGPEREQGDVGRKTLTFHEDRNPAKALDNDIGL